jgi:hypothetical protein
VISIGKLAPEDRAEWETLSRGYNAFYQRALPPEMTGRAWKAFQEDTAMSAIPAAIVAARNGYLLGP